MLCDKIVWNWLSGSGDDENVNSFQTEGQMNDGHQESRKAYLKKLSAQVSQKHVKGKFIPLNFQTNELFHPLIA